MALSVTNIAAHALDFHSKDVADAIIKANLVSSFLKDKGKLKVVSGGASFHEKLMYAQNAGFRWMKKSGDIPLNNIDYITDAVYQIRVLAGPLFIYDLDKKMASGDAQILDLVETTIENAKSTMGNIMGEAIFNDGANADALHGLGLISSATAGQTVGGISPTDLALWENQRNTVGTAAFNSNQAGIAMMALMAQDCAQNANDYPDLIATTKAVWDLYLLSTTNVARLVDVKVGSLGYQTLDFMGIPVGWDYNCAAGRMYFINSRYLFLRVLEGGNFMTSDWERVQGQLADYCTMHFYGQLTTNNRSKQGIITNVTA